MALLGVIRRWHHREGLSIRNIRHLYQDLVQLGYAGTVLMTLIAINYMMK